MSIAGSRSFLRNAAGKKCSSLVRLHHHAVSYVLSSRNYITTLCLMETTLSLSWFPDDNDKKHIGGGAQTTGPSALAAG